MWEWFIHFFVLTKLLWTFIHIEIVIPFQSSEHKAQYNGLGLTLPQRSDIQLFKQWPNEISNQTPGLISRVLWSSVMFHLLHRVPIDRNRIMSTHFFPIPAQIPPWKLNFCHFLLILPPCFFSCHIWLFTGQID